MVGQGKFAIVKEEAALQSEGGMGFFLVISPNITSLAYWSLRAPIPVFIYTPPCFFPSMKFFLSLHVFLW